jgi:hypothetical protein
MSNGATPLDGLTEIRTANRAEFDPLDLTASSGLIPENMRSVIQFVQNFLVLTPRVYYYDRNDVPENIAIGFDVNASISSRIKAISDLTRFAPDWLKHVTNFLPTLSIGGAVTPFESASGGVQAHAEIEISTPSFLNLIKGKIGEKISGASLTFAADTIFRSKESWQLNNAYSPIDQSFEVSGGATLTIRGLDLRANISRTSSRRTITTEVDGKVRTIVVQHVTTKAGNIDTNLLESFGVSLGRDGRLLDDEWYVYDYGLR